MWLAPTTVHVVPLAVCSLVDVLALKLLRILVVRLHFFPDPHLNVFACGRAGVCVQRDLSTQKEISGPEGENCLGPRHQPQPHIRLTFSGLETAEFLCESKQIRINAVPHTPPVTFSQPCFRSERAHTTHTDQAHGPSRATGGHAKLALNHHHELINSLLGGLPQVASRPRRSSPSRPTPNSCPATRSWACSGSTSSPTWSGSVRGCLFFLLRVGVVGWCDVSVSDLSFQACCSVDACVPNSQRSPPHLLLVCS